MTISDIEDNAQKIKVKNGKVQIKIYKLRQSK